MGKWTIGKELEDTAKAAGSGFALGRLSGSKSDDKSTDTGSAAKGDAVTVDKGLYRRGGYVSARPSGKRDYPKGKR